MSADEALVQERAAMDRAVNRGAAVNFLGTLGKTLIPVFFILITRMFGPEVMGIFVLAYVALETVAGLTVAGVNDGVLMFASRVIDDPDRRDELYDVLANAFVISLVIVLLLIVLSRVGDGALVHRLSPEHPELVPALRIMILGLPFYVCAIIVISATKALMVMTWDALIIGFLRPFLLLVGALVCSVAAPTVEGLAWAYFLASFGIGLASVFVFARYFSFSELRHRLLHFRFSWPLVRFSIPQNLNLTFNTFITNLDVMMLSAFRFPPATVGLYGVGAQIVNNLRLVRTGFSGAFAPVITRLHARGDREGLSASYTRVSRLSLSLVLPIAIAIIVHRDDLLGLFHESFHGEAGFMLVLLGVPLISCVVGMAGSIIVMTGHSQWNLLNSFLVTGLNFVLNYLLIPLYGVFGAALATLCSSSVVAILQVIEVQVLVGARLDLRSAATPLLAALPAAAIMATFYTLVPDSTLLGRLATTALSLGSYALVAAALGILPSRSQRRLTRVEGQEG